MQTILSFDDWLLESHGAIRLDCGLWYTNTPEPIEHLGVCRAGGTRDGTKQ
jgi:hypothetical protein